MPFESMNRTGATPINVHIIDGYCATAIGIKYLIEKDKSLRVSAVSHTTEDALATIQEVTSDVILLEPEMPLNGDKELIPFITEKTQSRILLFSGTSNTNILDTAILLGASGIVSKSDSPQQLIKAIQCVHNGEVWLNRNATARVLVQAARMNQGDKSSHHEQLMETLSVKERKVFEAVVNSSERKIFDIAEELNISQHTLRNHLASIYGKLGVNNRLSLFAFAKNMVKSGS